MQEIRKRTTTRVSPEKRISRLEVLVAEMDQNLSKLTQIVGSMVNASPSAEMKKDITNHIWFCHSCGARLGIYDRDKGQLRIRYKEHIVYITPGLRGKVEVPCRRCSFINLLEDNSKENT